MVPFDTKKKSESSKAWDFFIVFLDLFESCTYIIILSYRILQRLQNNVITFLVKILKFHYFISLRCMEWSSPASNIDLSIINSRDFKIKL
jgi:hypothetical protein